MKDIELACAIELKLLGIIKEIYNLGRDSKDNFTTINEEAFMIQINEIYNPPKFKNGDSVRVISGRFKGCNGVIQDIGNIEKAIAVKLEDNMAFSSCVCYVYYTDIEEMEHNE